MRNEGGNPSRMLGMVQMSINISFCCLNASTGERGKEAETHNLRWFVFKKGSGADDAEVGFTLPFLRSCLPSPYPADLSPSSSPQAGHQGGTSAREGTERARIAPAEERLGQTPSLPSRSSSDRTHQLSFTALPIRPCWWGVGCGVS